MATAKKTPATPADNATRQHYRLATGKPVNQPVPAGKKTPA